MVCVKPSEPGVKEPACAVGSFAWRAVSWKPHRCWAGSATVTTRCCVAPAVYVSPLGNVILTLPEPPPDE